MNIHAQTRWWYVYDERGVLVHSVRCHTESGALADAASVTGRNPAFLNAQTTYKPSTK